MNDISCDILDHEDDERRGCLFIAWPPAFICSKTAGNIENVKNNSVGGGVFLKQSLRLDTVT